MLDRRTVLRAVGVGGALTLLSGCESSPLRIWTVAGNHIDRLDPLDTLMRRLLEERAIRAGALAVARQGKLLFERAYTWAEPDYPTTDPQSPFRLASVSKAFTAALTHELVQAGRLRLDTPVFPFLELERPALPAQAADARLQTITVQHLVNHSGGWDRQTAGYDPVFKMRDIARTLDLQRPPMTRDIARFMVGEPLQFAPGTGERYSNFGYVLLGLIAEKATGQSYSDVLRERVADPLGISDVFLARTRKDRRLPNEGFYEQPGSGLTPEFPKQSIRVPVAYGGEGWLTEAMDAAGGLAATAGAVARLIGHYAVWGLGPRRRGRWARTGGMAGTSSYAMSRPDGLDFCVVLNTRTALADAAAQINAVLDAAKV